MYKLAIRLMVIVMLYYNLFSMCDSFPYLGMFLVFFI